MLLSNPTGQAEEARMTSETTARISAGTVAGGYEPVREAFDAVPAFSPTQGGISFAKAATFCAAAATE
jgi:hypothetical protein